MELLKQQLEEMKTAQDRFESMSAEFDILKMEKNELVQLKEAEIGELKAKLNDLEAGHGKTVGKNTCF